MSTNESREPGKPRLAIWRWLTEPIAAPRAPKEPGLSADVPSAGEGAVLSISEGNHRTARLLSTLLLVVLVATVIRIVYTAFASKVPPAVLATCAVTALAYGLSRTRYYAIAAGLTVVALSFPSFVAVLGEAECSEILIRTRLVWLVLPLILSSLLLSARGTAIVAALNFVGILLLPALDPSLNMQSVAGSLGLVGTASVLIVISIHHRNLLERDRRARLEESERRYRTLFESASDAIMIHSPEGPILEVNEVACEQLGYSRDELLHMTPADIDSSEYAPLVPQRVAELQREGHLLFETEHVRRDGSIIPTEVSSRTIEYGGQPVVLSIARDVSERVLAEEALRTSEERLQLALEATTDGLFDWNMQTGEAYYSPRYYTMLGYKVDELPASFDAWITLLHPTDKEHALRVIDEYGEGKRDRHSIELRLRAKSGEWRWILSRGRVTERSASGEPIRIVGTHADVTERRRAQEALLRERDLVARITETSPAGIVLVNRQGQITFSNLRAQEVLGLTVDAITKRTYNAPEWRLTDYEGHPFPDEQLPFAQVMRTGQPVFDVRHAIERPDGQRALLSINAAPLYDEAGKVDGMVATVDDITTRVRMEKELRNERDFAESLIETAQTIVLLLDTEGRIVRFNPYMEEISGYRLEEVQGKDWFTTFLPAQLHARIRRVFTQAVGDIRTRGNVNTIVTRDGQERLIEWYDKTLKDVDGNAVGLLAVGQNVTERVQADRALRLYAERLEILREIDRGILTAQSTHATAQAAVSRIRRLIPCQRIGVVLIDTVTTQAEIVAFDDDVESQIPLDIRLSLETLEDVVEQLLQGKVVALEDLPARGEVFEILYQEGVRLSVIFPLLFGGDLIGALTFLLTEGETFTPEYEGVARQLADQLAIAIQQARLHEQVQRHAEELERRVAERTAELSRMVDLMTGREIRMAELKEVIKQLHAQLEAAGLTPVADDPLAEWRSEP